MAHYTDPDKQTRVISKPFKGGKPGKKSLLTWGIILFVIAVAGYIGYNYYQAHKTRSTKTYTGSDYGHVDPNVQNLTNLSNTAQTQGIDAAIVQFDEIINGEKNRQQKAAYLAAKANLCLTYKKYDCVIDANNKSMAIAGESAEILIINGDAAYLMNQKSQGNDYYKKAIVILQPVNSSTSRATITRLQNIIDGKPVGDQGQ